MERAVKGISWNVIGHIFWPYFLLWNLQSQYSLSWNLKMLHFLMWNHGGGGFSAEFRAGVCRPQFQSVSVGKTNFCENNTLG